jgi:transposase
MVECWELKPLVQALQALRGISLISAVVLVAEVEDFARFARATQFMGAAPRSSGSSACPPTYTGLVPSEHSSGEGRRQGRITRTGNRHVRRILVESAWAYRYRPVVSELIRRRSRGVAAGVKQIAARAQVRLCGRLARMLASGKPPNKAITAVARELAGFVWSIARQEVLLEAA